LLESAEIRRMVLPALRADYRAVESYRWSGGEPPLTVPVHVHVGDRDPKVRIDEAREWRVQTRGRFTLTTYPGGHFYLTGQVRALGAAVAAELAAA
jgi:surfactin synthase thioesterase subunit